MKTGRPESTEYAPFYETYVSKVDGDSPFEVLEAQIAATRDLISNLDDSQARHRYEPGKWSIKEVLGHLVDTERVFAYRAMCIARGEAASLPGMDENEYTAGGRFDERSVASLLEEQQHSRRATLAMFDSLDSAAWMAKGIANDVEVSVRALAFIIAGHHEHHLRVLRERYLD